MVFGGPRIADVHLARGPTDALLQHELGQHRRCGRRAQPRCLADLAAEWADGEHGDLVGEVLHGLHIPSLVSDVLDGSWCAPYVRLTMERRNA
ncbi:hypothetical protein SDC9_168102 [bioreactor metagenome]|uniref:Uncharacterized protein n=1 Tax=bioreactor metagenome TaxID=1076179 RepID=A0A645GA03_9ZZZZ